MSSEERDIDRSAYFITEGTILSADVGIDAQGSADLVPKPLVLSEPARAVFYVADFPNTPWEDLSYLEAGVWLHVEDDAGPGLFCPWMYVNDDASLIGGRETMGYPKKMADITLVEEGETVIGSVVRKGIEIIRLEVALSGAIENPRTFSSHRIVAAIGTPLTGMKLIDSPAPGDRVHRARHASGVLTVNPSKRDRLAQMKPAPEVDAQYLVADMGALRGPEASKAKLTTDIDRAWIARNHLERSW